MTAAASLVKEYTLVKKVYNYLMKTIKPLTDRIICKLIEAEKQTSGGIILPGSKKETNKTKQFEILSVGPEVVQFKPGQKIILGSYQYLEVELGNDTLYITREHEIEALIEDDPQDIHSPKRPDASPQ